MRRKPRDPAGPGRTSGAIENHQRGVRVPLPPLETFLQRAKKELGLRGDSVAVRLIHDAEMKRLNATFRGKKTIVRAGTTLNIPSNAPHQFHNTSSRPVRMLCICSPAGQEKFFTEVGVPVATRTTPPPRLNEDDAAAFIARVKALAPKYRTELLREA